MKTYITEQRKKLIGFLSANRDRSFTIEDIASSLSSCGISRSSIYRNINILVAEGEVVRTAKEGTNSFLYQYVGDTDCCHHLHVQCTKCGVIGHLDDKATDTVVRKALSESDFSIDTSKTILYGACKGCKIK